MPRLALGTTKNGGSAGHGWRGHPEPFFVTPSPFLSPRAQARGLLGTCVPRDDIPDAVTNEMRDALAGAWQDKVGGPFLNNSHTPLTIIKNLRIFNT
jgi:hypothetical protein